MKALLKNIQGSRRLVLIISLLMMFTLIAYWLVYLVTTGNGPVSVFAALVMVLLGAISMVLGLYTTKFTKAAIYSSISVAMLASTFAFMVTAVSWVRVADVVVLTVVAALMAVCAVLSVLTVKDSSYNIAKHKILLAYLAEGVVLGSVMTLFVPHLASSVLLTLAAIVSFLFIESRLALWLRDNPPPSLFVVRVAPVGIESFRQETQVVFHSRRPNTWLSGWHRKLYRAYIQN